VCVCVCVCVCVLHECGIARSWTRDLSSCTFNAVTMPPGHLSDMTQCTCIQTATGTNSRSMYIPECSFLTVQHFTLQLVTLLIHPTATQTHHHAIHDLSTYTPTANKTTMCVTATLPSSKVWRYQDMTSGTSNHQNNMPMVPNILQNMTSY